MSKKVISSLDIDAKDFILNNNLFEHIQDNYSKYIGSGIDGISTWGIPNSTANIQKVKADNSLMYPSEIVYKAKYTFDYEGKRQTVHLNNDYTKVAVFFGDAMAFGEGINDEETFPSVFEKFNCEYRSYNYGFLGHGPSHMLIQVQSQKFRDKFSSKEGDIFYIYRDDAVKVTVGEVPWGNGYPKFVLNNNEIVHKGFFGGDKYKPDDMYLPSQFTVEDYNTTVHVFKKVEKELKGISPNLNLNIIIVPLSFSNIEITSLLQQSSINVYDFSSTDMEHYSGVKARYLDGIHTPYSNIILNQRLSYFINKPKKTHTIYLNSEYSDIEIGIDRIIQQSFMIPSMIDFPYDDAGVIISQILQKYTATPPTNINYIELSKEWFYKKLEILNKVTFHESIDELKTQYDCFSNNIDLLNLFYKEYYTFKSIHIL